MWIVYRKTGSYHYIGERADEKAEQRAKRIAGMNEPEVEAYKPICKVENYRGVDERVNLICAAPDLLAACRAALDGMPQGLDWSGLRLQLSEAIAKATGQQ